MILPDDGADFRELSRVIAERAGVTVGSYKDKCLRRRIAVRMRASGVHCFDDYRALLLASPEEVARLRDALTINVTRFYRNPETWNTLRQQHLPSLWHEREGHLRAWSAGCSSGEEPYTIAMVIAELARGTATPHWFARLDIDATDIDRPSLERADAARYRPDAFQETPPELVERYTLPVGPVRAVRPDLRARVHVREYDLHAARPPRNQYDLIMCRNVVIYFERPMQERVFSLFATHLAIGGLLVLGKVETLLGPARDLLALVDPRERIYRRTA